MNRTTPDPVKRKNLLSLIIPCYNESSRIDIMMQGLADFEEKWKSDYEVIIVDDGSKDDTAGKVKQSIDTKYTFLKEKARVEILPANKGKGGALKHGVSLANGDFILTLDADMSTRPTELIGWQKRDSRVLAADDTIFIGARRHPEGTVDALHSRKLIGGIFNGIVQILTSLQHKDTQCGFKLYPRDVARFLFGNMRSNGWAHDVELLYQADLVDLKIVDMPIKWVNQPESKVHVIKDSITMFFGVLGIVMRIWFYNSFILPFRMPDTFTPEQRKQVRGKAIFNVLALLLVIVMPAMSFQYGISGDEHHHFEYGNSIYNYFFHGDTSVQVIGANAIQYYGGIFDFITAFTYTVFHFTDHYSTMHFINALVGAIGIIYAGKLARLLNGWEAAILAMVLLILSPSWFGHNFNNPKDIPFSVGYTAGVYFILLFLRALPQPNTKHIFGLICSIGWAMGVRIGGVLLIAYLGLFIGIYALYTRQIKAVINVRIISKVIIVAVAGYLIALICWPWAQLDILGKPMESLKVMSNFLVNIGILYDGKKLLSNQVPWYYIPKYILYTAPLVVLAGFAIGLVAMPVITRHRKNMLLFMLLVLFTAVFPVVYVIYKKSSLYDGWRHFLFVYPPLVVIASVGWMALVRAKQKAIKFATIALIVAGLVLPLRFCIANHPFESLYFNEIAGGIKGIYGKYDTDYYMLGVKPAFKWLVEHEHLENKKAIIATNCIFPLHAYVYLSHYKNLPRKYDQIYERFADFRRDSVYDYYAKNYPDFRDTFGLWEDYVRFYERYSKDWDYCILFSRFVDASQLTTGNWPPPETIHTIDVDGVPIAAILKRKTKKDFEGFQLMKAKKYDEAKSMFLASLVEYPNNDLVWEALCEIYDAEGNTDSTIYAGKNALKNYPGDVNVYQAMGNAYLKAHKPDSAFQLYKNLEPFNPGYSHFLLAYTYAMGGDAQKAFMEIDNAIEADPYMEQSYKLGMQIAKQTKDGEKEQEYYDKAMKAFPENGEGK